MAQRKKMTRYMQNKIIEGLVNGHTMSGTCELLNISRVTETKFRKKNATYRKRVNEALEQRTEIVEDVLHGVVLGGNIQAIRFYLINRAKPRWKSEFGKAVEDADSISLVNVSFGKSPKKDGE